MKVLIWVFVTLMSLAAFSDSDKERKDDRKEDKKELRGHPVPLSVFDVIPLNSPVKESVAKFLLKVPNGFEIDEVKYKIQNANHRFEKETSHQKINLVNGPQGKELQIPISKLSPGFYKLYVKVIDRKKKEHNYHSRFRDHAKFAIDQSLEVKMPDPKINNATLLGVDSDNDGIRDDVQRWINENFSSMPDVKIALKQYAVDVESSFLTASDKQASILSSLETLKAQECFSDVARESGMTSREIINNRKKVDAIYMNTRERIEAELKADE
ncbi:MAG: hypothetical protein Q7U04_06760, partial [Bacteriovorax sp.]|nr:hypothetical protein [Bacteriovorax sp.]